MFYRVSENVGIVEVCAVVFSPNTTCPINFDFDVRLATENGTAGKSVFENTLFTRG